MVLGSVPMLFLIKLRDQCSFSKLYSIYKQTNPLLECCVTELQKRHRAVLGKRLCSNENKTSTKMCLTYVYMCVLSPHLTVSTAHCCPRCIALIRCGMMYSLGNVLLSRRGAEVEIDTEKQEFDSDLDV